MVLPRWLSDNQEALAVTGEPGQALDHDRMVMPIEAVVSLISIAMKRAGMITEPKIHLIETAQPLASTCKVLVRRETFYDVTTINETL